MPYYGQESRIPNLGLGLASIGDAIGAWRQAGKQRELEQGRMSLLDALAAPPEGADPSQPDAGAPLRNLLQRLDTKGRAALLASDSFDKLLQGALSSKIGGAGYQHLAGSQAAQFLGVDPKDFEGGVIQVSPEGKIDTVIAPPKLAEGKGPKSLGNGWIWNDKEGLSRLPNYLEEEMALRWQPKEASDNLGMSQPMALKTKARDPVTGEMVERTSTFEFVPRKGGGGFVRAGPPLMESEERTPLPKAEAGAVQGAREGIRLVKELRSLLFQGAKGDQLNEGALMSKALGLPGAIAPEGASIEPKVLQAVDPYVRATTGAALNQQELENARAMFVPSIGDGKELVRDKLDRLERFLAGDLGLMGMVAVPGSPLSSWVATHPGEGAQVGAGAKAPEISTKEQYDKLKSGDPFVWNGKRGVKP